MFYVFNFEFFPGFVEPRSKERNLSCSWRRSWDFNSLRQLDLISWWNCTCQVDIVNSVRASLVFLVFVPSWQALKACGPQTAHHPHRPGLHQQRQRLWYFQTRVWLSFGNYPLKVNFVWHIADNVESCLCLLFVHHFFIHCIVCRLFVYLLCILFVLLSVFGPPEWGLALRDRCGAPFILSNLISSSFRPLERQNKKKTELTNKNRRKQIADRQVQTVFQSKNKSWTSSIFFLATIVTLHFTPAPVAHSFGACFILQQTRFYSSLNV